MGELTGLYQNIALTNLLARRPRGRYIAPLILPEYVINKKSGSIYKANPNNYNLVPHDTYRAPGAEAKVLWEENPTTIDFNVRDHSLSSLLPDEFRDIDTALNEEINKVQKITEALDLVREINLVDKITTVATASSNTDSPSEKFDAAVPTIDPIEYLIGRINLMLGKLGTRPNLVAMDYQVAAAIFANAKFREGVKGVLTQRDLAPTTDAMAAFLQASLGVQQVLIADTAWKMPAVRLREASNPVVVPTRVWGEAVFIGYVAQPSLEYAGYGLHMRYNGPGATYGQTVVNGYLVEIARAAARKSDAYYVHSYYDDVIINPDAGYLVTDTLT